MDSAMNRDFKANFTMEFQNRPQTEIFCVPTLSKNVPGVQISAISVENDRDIERAT